MTDKLTKEKLESTLQDVRKAYRLLYVYQQRVLDTVKFIGDLFSRNYIGGWSKFSKSAPRNGQGSLGNWAWDWLNMYSYDFYFGEQDDVKFSIWVVSDTGYYDNEALNNANEKELNTFSPIVDAETKLVFIVGKNTWYTEKGFEDFEKTMLKKDSSIFISENSEGKVFAKSYNLSSFLNQDETINQCKDFEKLCKEHGISEIKVSIKY